MSWDKIYSFFHLLDRFQKIQRVTYSSHDRQRENDAEHSYQLAMMAWYICETHKLKHDIDKVIRYALVHDLVEVYAGDTMALGRNEKEQSLKEQREQEAIQKLKKNFSEFPDLSEWISNYEQKKDPESKYIYALDKYLATINSYDKDGKIWKDHHCCLQDIEKSLSKTQCDPCIYELANNLLSKIQKDTYLFEQKPTI